MLKDVNEKEIALDKEIEYLKSYIDLQKLRFSDTDDIDIRFNVRGNPFDSYVPPFLFIGFIENAFKYGINYKKNSFIDIHFEISKGSFCFSISNSIHRLHEIPQHGLGLKNIRDRLQLLYPEKYKLDINETNNIFTVVLEVNLNK
jgi:LytS/YehU family sensor histidine kinase